MLVGWGREYTGGAGYVEVAGMLLHCVAAGHVCCGMKGRSWQLCRRAFTTVYSVWV
jgi:hypothetical protein